MFKNASVRLLWNKHGDTLTHVMGRSFRPVYVQQEVDGCYSNLTFQKSRTVQKYEPLRLGLVKVVARTRLGWISHPWYFTRADFEDCTSIKKKMLSGAEKWGIWTDLGSNHVFASIFGWMVFLHLQAHTSDSLSLCAPLNRLHFSKQDTCSCHCVLEVKNVWDTFRF